MELRSKFKIPRENEVRFLAAIKKLNKAAVKVGIAEASVTVLRYEAQKDKDPRTGRGFIRQWVIYEIRGERPKLNGWRFLAKVEPHENGNILLVAHGAEVPLEWHSKEKEMKCEHCQVQRYRKEYYLVGNDAGEIKSIGSSCVKDFTGHKTPQAVASWFELLLLAESAENFDEGGYYNNGPEHFLVTDLVTQTLAILRMDGFVSEKSSGERNGPSSASHLSFLLSDPSDAKSKEAWKEAMERYQSDAEDVEVTSQIVDYLLARKTNPASTNFDMNLAIMAEEKVLSVFKLSFLVAGVFLAAKALELSRYTGQHRTKAEKSNEYIGEVGKRLPLGKLTVVGCRLFPNGQYGATTLLEFEDSNGNCLKWFASGDRDIEAGSIYEVTATIKKHEEYHDRRQTYLTRCKLKRVVEDASVQSQA